MSQSRLRPLAHHCSKKDPKKSNYSPIRRIATVNIRQKASTTSPVHPLHSQAVPPTLHHSHMQRLSTVARPVRGPPPPLRPPTPEEKKHPQVPHPRPPPPVRPPPRSCHKAQRPPYRWPFIRACLRQTPIPFLCSCRSRIAPRLSAVGGSAGLPASWPTPLTEYRFRCWVFSCRPHRKTAIWDGQRPVGIWERNRHRVPLCRKEGFPPSLYGFPAFSGCSSAS